MSLHPHIRRLAWTVQRFGAGASPAERNASRSPSTKRLDLAWVAGLRKDFLTLLKNLPRVLDYSTAHRLKEAVQVYRTHFDETVFEHFLNMLETSNRGRAYGISEWTQKNLRDVAWTFYIELGVPIGDADEYRGEEHQFARFKREYPAWKLRVQRKASAFWKAMSNLIAWYESSQGQGKSLEIRVPSSELHELSGFRTTLKSYDSDDARNVEELSIIQEGLRRYRKRASVIAPVLLRRAIPITFEFKPRLDKGGDYEGHGGGHINFYASSLSKQKGPSRVVHTIAHEMGHHLWRTYLSKDAQDYWYAAIRGDYGELNIAELLRVWPGDAWAFQFPEIMGETDPILALQVEAISHDVGYTKELQSKADFQRLYDTGERTLRVPTTPITGYANKNPEEAFCEAIGMLVAYGPRTVHAKVRSWLETVLGGEVRAASPARSKRKARR